MAHGSHARRISRVRDVLARRREREAVPHEGFAPASAWIATAGYADVDEAVRTNFVSCVGARAAFVESIEDRVISRAPRPCGECSTNCSTPKRLSDDAASAESVRQPTHVDTRALQLLQFVTLQ